MCLRGWLVYLSHEKVQTGLNLYALSLTCSSEPVLSNAKVRHCRPANWRQEDHSPPGVNSGLSSH